MNIRPVLCVAVVVTMPAVGCSRSDTSPSASGVPSEAESPAPSGAVGLRGQIQPGTLPAPLPAPPKPSTPATTRGIAATVAPTKAVFAHYEPLAFKVTYANVSDEGFTLYDHDFPLYWEYTFVGVGENNRGKEWRPRCGLKIDRIGLTVTPLAAGATSTVSIRLTVREFPLLPLPPGKYEMTARIGLYEAPKWFSKPKYPYWKGTVTTAPVEFEVEATEGSEWRLSFMHYEMVSIRGEVRREMQIDFTCEASGEYEATWVSHEHLAADGKREAHNRGRLDRRRLAQIWWHIERARLDAIGADEMGLIDHIGYASVYRGVVAFRQGTNVKRIAYKRDGRDYDSWSRDTSPEFREGASRFTGLVKGLRRLSLAGFDGP